MLNYSLLMAPAPSGGQQGSALPSILMLVGIFVVFYFFMIRPQSKKAKEQKKFIESIGKGERVVTISGIHGIINKIEDNTILLEVSPGMYLKIEKTTLSMEWTKAAQQAAKKLEDNKNTA